VKIKLLNSKQIGKKLKKLMSQDFSFYWAVAWATETELADILLANKKKIQQLVIGTDFAQTSPALLQKLKPIKNVRIKLSNGSSSIFHPKVYSFVKDNNVSAIVGSANFTNGGTKLNDEAAFLIEGTLGDESLNNLLESISSWWKEGHQIEDDFLTAYELRWLSTQKHKKALEKPLRIYSPTDKSTHPDLLSTSWSDYLAELKASAQEEFEDRLAVLQNAQQLFNSVTGFNQLDTLPRKAIAGIIGRKEILGTALEGLEWAWFGSMKGAGDFKNRIIENDLNMSAALDNIPSTGEVTEEHYIQFVERFLSAFAESERQGGVPTASRLLAMKRPDYFVCVDSKNKKRLGADMGFSPWSLNLDNYWEHVVEPITQAKWWNTKRPAGGVDGRAWDARAAMLDVIYMDRD
jgi:HKD family nuclease